MPGLRRTLLDLVAAASLTTSVTTSTGCFDTDDDKPPKPPDMKTTDCEAFVEYRERIVPPAPADYELLLQACEADARRCFELCDAVVRKLEGGSYEHVAHVCRVERDAAAHEVWTGYFPSADGHCVESIIVDGRRPFGLRSARKPSANAVGTHLARAAWFEGASVHAFVALARELAKRDAPEEIIRSAQRAAFDEVRHARVIGALARSYGAAPPRVEVDVPRRRSLESIATENAIEGLVGETWAALVATWQSRNAPAPLRPTYAQIAVDEAGHAELARQIDRWAKPKLSRAACRRVDAARDRAIDQLASTVKGFSRPLVRDLGLPNARAARSLFDGATQTQLWA